MRRRRRTKVVSNASSNTNSDEEDEAYELAYRCFCGLCPHCGRCTCGYKVSFITEDSFIAKWPKLTIPSMIKAPHLPKPNL
mmetsp:Transcript_3723/g.7910  ORF Transcript_3723/g.7910 Transcript_3723/m.7910 type:complete len:81 (-) Transcript_3723:483-725(-)